MIIRGIINAGNPSIIFANVLDANGDPIQTATITAIAVAVYDLDDNSETWLHSPAVSDCVYDTYQSDPRCPRYNLAVALDSSACPDGDSTYQAQITITPSLGEPYTVVAMLQTRNVIGQQ